MPPRKAKTAQTAATSSTHPKPSVSAPISNVPSSVNLSASPSKATPAVEREEVAGMEGWEELNRKKWRGLGLSDPIKAVEVRDINMHFKNLCNAVKQHRTSGFFYPHF